MNDDVGIIPAEVIAEHRDFNLVAELEIARCVRCASEPARDVRVIAHLLAAWSIGEFLVADVTLLRIFELIDIAGCHLHPILSRQELDQLRLNLLKGIE